MRSGWTIAVGLMLLGIPGPAAAQAEGSLVPDRKTILDLVTGAKGFEAVKGERGLRLEVADPLPDGRVPVVALALVPSERKRAGWEQEIGLLEKRIEQLQAEMAGADETQEYKLATKIARARTEIQRILDSVRARGKNVNLAEWRAVSLGLVLLKKREGKWTLTSSLPLGVWTSADLGAPPADTDLLVQSGDFNRNQFSELRLSALVDLLATRARDTGTRTHSHHFLVEFFPQGPTITFQLDGGIDSGGMCEDPIDGMVTARYWIRSPKNKPAELSLSRNRSMCDRGEGASDPHKNKPGFERFAWSNKYRRWQPFQHLQPDSYLIVAASGREKERLQKTLGSLKRRRIRRRFRLGKSYPRMAMSDDFSGLKPGYHLIVLGACPDLPKANKLMRQLKKRYRGRGLSYSVRGYRRKKGSRLLGTCPRAR